MRRQTLLQSHATMPKLLLIPSPPLLPGYAPVSSLMAAKLSVCPPPSAGAGVQHGGEVCPHGGVPAGPGCQEGADWPAHHPLPAGARPLGRGEARAHPRLPAGQPHPVYPFFLRKHWFFNDKKKVSVDRESSGSCWSFCSCSTIVWIVCGLASLSYDVPESSRLKVTLIRIPKPQRVSHLHP